MTQITPENGLPATPVTALHQTADQFLWLTTPAGLTRFDGQRMVTVPAGAIATNTSRPFEAVGLGGTGGTQFWVATRDGLFQRTDGGFQPVAFNDPATAASILCVASRQAGGRDARFTGPLWIGTERGVYELYKGMLQPVWKVRPEAAWHLAEGANGVGVGTAGGIWHYRPADGVWAQLTTTSSARAECPPVLAADGGMLWHASAEGAGQQVGTQQPKFVPLRGVAPGCYRWAASDRAGNRWLVWGAIMLLPLWYPGGSWVADHAWMISGTGLVMGLVGVRIWVVEARKWRQEQRRNPIHRWPPLPAHDLSFIRSRLQRR